MTKRDPFKYFKTSPEIIRLAVMMYIRFPLSLRNVEDLLHERGIDISHETVRFWWNRFGPLFAAEIRKKRVSQMRAYSNWQWHLDEVFVRINGETHYLWRAVDHEGEVLESYVTKRRDRKAALKFLRKTMKRHGNPHSLVTDKLRSYGAAMKVVGNVDKQETGRWLNNRAENSHQPFRRRERAMIRFRRMRTLQNARSLKKPIAALADEWRFGGNELKVSECCSITNLHFQSLRLNKDNTKWQLMSDPNDLQALLDEAWRHLTRGVADSRSPARYPTFATVAPDGTPEARTVALRGAFRSQSVLEVHTDIATSKVAALQHNPKAAFHVWVPRADLQIRITATVEIQTGSDAEQKWDRVPEGSRVSYGTRPTPGTAILDAYAYEKPSDRERFAVLRCNLLQVDLVHLGARHRRAEFIRENEWAGTWLAP